MKLVNYYTNNIDRGMSFAQQTFGKSPNPHAQLGNLPVVSLHYANWSPVSNTTHYLHHPEGAAAVVFYML